MPYSETLKAYLETGEQELYPTLEIEWPDGEIGRYATADMAIPGVGNFAGIIESINEPTEGVSARYAGLAVLETRVTLIDKTGELRRHLKGPRECRGVEATVKMGCPRAAVPYGDWQVVIAGIFDRPRYHSGNRVDLVIRTDDRWLTSPALRLAVLQSEWEDLPEENRDVWMPLIFGIHDSVGLSDKGMVPTVKVAQRGDSLRWDLVAHGWMQSVPRVYVGSGDSFTLATPGHYLMQRLFREGEALTLIVWDGTAEHTPASDQEVRVDVSGLTLDGTIPTQAEIDADPRANLAANPVGQLRLWLRLYARNLWRSGAYPDEVGIDSASWDAAEEYAERYGLSGAFRIGGDKEQRTALEVITEWLGNWTMFRAYWTAAGELALGVFDCRWPGHGTGTAFNLIREAGKLMMNKPTIEPDAEGILDRVTVAHLFDAAQSKSWSTLEVQDLTRSERHTHDMRLTMGPSSRED